MKKYDTVVTRKRSRSYKILEMYNNTVLIADQQNGKTFKVLKEDIKVIETDWYPYQKR